MAQREFSPAGRTRGKTTCHSFDETTIDCLWLSHGQIVVVRHANWKELAAYHHKGVDDMTNHDLSTAKAQTIDGWFRRRLWRRWSCLGDGPAGENFPFARSITSLILGLIVDIYFRARLLQRIASRVCRHLDVRRSLPRRVTTLSIQ